jgi:hypothetical protein
MKRPGDAFNSSPLVTIETIGTIGRSVVIDGHNLLQRPNKFGAPIVTTIFRQMGDEWSGERQLLPFPSSVTHLSKYRGDDCTTSKSLQSLLVFARYRMAAPIVPIVSIVTRGSVYRSRGRRPAVSHPTTTRSGCGNHRRNHRAKQTF